MFDIPDRVTGAHFDVPVFPADHPLRTVHADLDVYRVAIDKTDGGWQVSSPTAHGTVTCHDLADAFAAAVAAADCQLRLQETVGCAGKSWLTVVDSDGVIVEVGAVRREPTSPADIAALASARTGGVAVLPFDVKPVPQRGDRIDAWILETAAL